MDTTRIPSDRSKDRFSLVIALLSVMIALLLFLAYLAEVKNPCSYTKADYGGSELSAVQCRSGLQQDIDSQIAANQPATTDPQNSGW